MFSSLRPLIVFDMDGTLMDSLPDLGNSCRYLLQSYHLPSIEDKTVRQMIGDGIPMLVKRVLDYQKEAAISIDRQEAINRFLHYYSQHSSDYTQPFPGALECLKEFKHRQWLIALCTNKVADVAQQILQYHLIDQYFDMIGGGDSFPHKKPHPCHLEGIINQLQANPQLTVMVGDHMNDIMVAKNAYVAGSIYAAWGYGNEEIATQATRYANNLQELPDIAADVIKKIKTNSQ